MDSQGTEQRQRIYQSRTQVGKYFLTFQGPCCFPQASRLLSQKPPFLTRLPTAFSLQTNILLPTKLPTFFLLTQSLLPTVFNFHRVVTSQNDCVVQLHCSYFSCHFFNHMIIINIHKHHKHPQTNFSIPMISCPSPCLLSHSSTFTPFIVKSFYLIVSLLLSLFFAS